GALLGPAAVAAGGDLEHSAQDRDGEAGLLRVDELESHEFSFAKKAAAFFRISRSISSTLIRLRSSRFSLSRSGCWLSALLAEPSCAAFTQFLTALSVRSRSSAIWLMLFPEVSTRRTTSARYSSVNARLFLLFFVTWTPIISSFWVST